MTTLTLPPTAKRDHLRGSLHAPVVLVEYGSFDCPHCRQAQVGVNRLEERFGDRFGFAYRHFPRNLPGSPSFRAAEAAEAAGTQGKFWDMLEVLFTHYDKLDELNLMMYAHTVGLDMAMFEQEMNQNVHAERVREDFESAVQCGVSSTPTFFINGVRHDDFWDYDTLIEAIYRSVPALKTEP